MMTNPLIPCVGVAGWVLWAVAWPGIAAAAPPLTDPTRPPEVVRAMPAPAAAVAPAAPVWPVLQSVQISATAAPSALIDGKIVRIGDRIGALTLVVIDRNGVLLRGPRFEQRLALLPGIARTASSRGPEVLSSARPPATGRSE